MELGSCSLSLDFWATALLSTFKTGNRKAFLNITIIDLAQFPGESTRSSWRCRKTPGVWVTWLIVAWQTRGRARGRALPTESQECHSDSDLRNKVLCILHIRSLVKYRQAQVQIHPRTHYGLIQFILSARPLIVTSPVPQAHASISARGRALPTESQECHSDRDLRNKVFSIPFHISTCTFTG